MSKLTGNGWKFTLLKLILLQEQNYVILVYVNFFKTSKSKTSKNSIAHISNFNLLVCIPLGKQTFLYAAQYQISMFRYHIRSQSNRLVLYVFFTDEYRTPAMLLTQKCLNASNCLLKKVLFFDTTMCLMLIHHMNIFYCKSTYYIPILCSIYYIIPYNKIIIIQVVFDV